MSSRRLAAIVSLAAGLVAIGVAADLAVKDFPRGPIALAVLAAALVGAWEGLVRRAGARALAFSAAALLAAGAIVLLLTGGNILALGLLAGAAAIALAAARIAYAAPVPLADAARPANPVLFMNPRSGGGKAERFHLAAEATARGIKPVTLGPGDDLSVLVEDAIRAGADALAMAGGDGSQAVVAAHAAEHGLPYACIPAGTRNHFALDLGVDREDVVGALDAFVDGGERRVDLAEVNGRVFVNNVSLGVYAEAVGKDAYRNAKLRTIMQTVPETLGPERQGSDLLWRDSGGAEHRCRTLLLVSNNRYRLARALGVGTRPRLDEGLLGVAQWEPHGPGGRRGADAGWLETDTTELTIDSDAPVPAGIDGEAATLEPPVRFRIRAQVLRVRIARQHPGSSPSAGLPHTPAGALRGLVRIAAGHREAELA